MSIEETPVSSEPETVYPAQTKSPDSSDSEPICLEGVNYSSIPWYRRRWSLVLMVLLFMPAALIVLLTGDTHYKSKGAVFQVPDKKKRSMILFLVIFLGFNLIRAFLL